MKEYDITSLVDLEWEFFQNTQNIGGRAACQGNREMFYIMRKGQALAWNEAMAHAWLRDLRQAKKRGQNPVMEKYARMMSSTDPKGYKKLEHLLPDVDAEAAALAASITAQTVAWAKQAAEYFPRFCSRGRPIQKEQDTVEEVSLETYCYSELIATCSVDTLRIFERYYKEKAARGENLYLEVENNTLELMGYPPVPEMEQRFL